MIKKSIMPSHLEDILRKNSKKGYYAGKDLYTEWIAKNPLGGDKFDNFYKHYKSDLKSKKKIFKDTAHGYPIANDLEERIQFPLRSRLPDSSYGGFSVGQLVGIPKMGYGVVIGFYRHHDLPYTTDGSPSISNKETIMDDGGAIRADVLVDGVFHRFPILDLRTIEAS
jgi:hypothetical protein